MLRHPKETKRAVLLRQRQRTRSLREMVCCKIVFLDTACFGSILFPARTPELILGTVPLHDHGSLHLCAT